MFYRLYLLQRCISSSFDETVDFFPERNASGTEPRDEYSFWRALKRFNGSELKNCASKDSDHLQNVPRRRRTKTTHGRISERSREALLEAHDLSRIKTRLSERLVPAQSRVAAGVSDGVGASFHLVLQPGPIPALVAGVHQGAYGLRETPRISRRDDLQPEHLAAATYEKTGHL